MGRTRPDPERADLLRRWRPAPVWLIGAATAFSLLGDQALYATLPIYFEELGLRPVEVGLILSANRWVRMATNELAHRVMRLGHRRSQFVTAVGLGAVATAVYATTPVLAVFVAARLLWGLCWSFIRHLGILTVMESTDGRRSGHVAGRLSGISRAGSVAGLFGGALLVERLGFGPALVVLTVLSLTALPLGWLGFAESETEYGSGSGAGAALQSAPGGEPGPGATVGLRSDTGDLVPAALGLAHGMVGPGLVMATLGAVLDQRLDTDGLLSAAVLTGAVLAARFVLESLGAARLGAISDVRGIGSAATGAFVVGAISLLIAAVTPSLPVLVTAVLCFFVSGTTLGSGLVGFAGARGSKPLARYVTASDLGSAAGPLIGWIALELFERRTLGLAIGAVVYGLAAAVANRGLPRAGRCGHGADPGSV